MNQLTLPYHFERRRPTPLRWSHWYLSILKLAVGLLLVLLITLLWLLHRNEIDEQRSTLIADVLWLEQSLRFHLDGNSEQLQQLALDLTRAKRQGELFDLRARHLLKNNPELRQLLWLDTSARTVHGMPTLDLPQPRQDSPGENPINRSLELARLGKPIYSDAYRTTEAAQFEVYVPIFDDGHYRGTLLAVYSLNGLLKQQVPWWFAEKYQVRIVDGNGNLLASKSRIDASATTLSYPVSLDPPGYGMVLQVTVYRGADNLAQTLIATLIVVLGAAVFWSLWAVRGLIQRRLAAEQALRSEYAFRKAMEDSLMVGMRARDLDGRVTYVNPAFLQMVGFRAEELIGHLKRSGAHFLEPDEVAKVSAVVMLPNHGVNPRVVGKDPQFIGQLAGSPVPAHAKCLVAPLAGVEHLVRGFDPIDTFAGLGPEAFGIGLPLLIDGVIAAHEVLALHK